METNKSLINYLMKLHQNTRMLTVAIQGFIKLVLEGRRCRNGYFRVDLKMQKMLIFKGSGDLYCQLDPCNVFI